jgi:hypothetical protein
MMGDNGLMMGDKRIMMGDKSSITGDKSSITRDKSSVMGTTPQSAAQLDGVAGRNDHSNKATTDVAPTLRPACAYLATSYKLGRSGGRFAGVTTGTEACRTDRSVKDRADMTSLH